MFVCLGGIVPGPWPHAPLFFQENGVYTIAKLILPNKQKNAAKTNLLQVTNISVALQYQVTEIWGNPDNLIYDFLEFLA